MKLNWCHHLSHCLHVVTNAAKHSLDFSLHRYFVAMVFSYSYSLSMMLNVVTKALAHTLDFSLDRHFVATVIFCSTSFLFVVHCATLYWNIKMSLSLSSTNSTIKKIVLTFWLIFQLIRHPQFNQNIAHIL